MRGVEAIALADGLTSLGGSTIHVYWSGAKKGQSFGLNDTTHSSSLNPQATDIGFSANAQRHSIRNKPFYAVM
ncbi:MAG: hypothetical protein JSC085_000765 [Candidatus Tokpelaia sp. JSC085]|nr:MAG: hypothetical protein JSC085_000765 [Candidatus Tokpelaia sp. JSC085]